MAAPQFNSAAIFGSQTKETFPDTPFRALRSVLPGNDGERIYRMGRGAYIFTVTGRLKASTRAGLESALGAGFSYRNGQLYTYTSGAGNNYANCMLASFGQSSPMQKVTFPDNSTGYTCTISATIEWTTPS